MGHGPAVGQTAQTGGDEGQWGECELLVPPGRSPHRSFRRLHPDEEAEAQQDSERAWPVFTQDEAPGPEQKFLRRLRPISKPLPHSVTLEPCRFRTAARFRHALHGGDSASLAHALSASSTPSVLGRPQRASVVAVDHASDSALNSACGAWVSSCKGLEQGPELRPPPPLSDQHPCPLGTLSRSLAVIHALSSPPLSPSAKSPFSSVLFPPEPLHPFTPSPCHPVAPRC